MTGFHGRERELALLHGLTRKASSSLVVIRGRRRIGKSRLIYEFSKTRRTFFFEGLPPVSHVTAEDQRENFALQMQRQMTMPAPRADDWGNLFWGLGREVEKGPVCVVFDEINWLGSKDPTFLGKLKIAWDQHLSRNPELILILCGSMSGWIERNIIASTGFFGRISLDMILESLPLNDCEAFWGEYSDRVSPFEKLKLLSVTGGVPRYLEEIDPTKTAEDNIRRLCFSKDGLLVGEFRLIFSDLFSHQSSLYREIVEVLVSGSKEVSALLAAVGRPSSGVFFEYLDELEKAGFVDRHYAWDIASKKYSKLSQVRLCDQYLRFYLKFIEPELEAIANGTAKLPTNLASILGLQFENLVLNNHLEVLRMLGLTANEIARCGPYFQTKTSRREGCQIDYLIETDGHCLFVCEIKFSPNPIGTDVIASMQQKIARLKVSKSYSIRPVLIHIGGVTDELIRSKYFTDILDFSTLLR